MIEKYLHPEFMRRSLVHVKQLEHSDDPSQICDITQVIKVKGKWTVNFTQKLILDQQHFFSVCQHMKDIGKPGIVIQELMDRYMFKNGGLQRLSVAAVWA